MSEIYLINERKYKFNILDENTLDFIKQYYRDIDTSKDNIYSDDKYSIYSSAFIIKFVIVCIFVFILWNYINNK
jgi:hypothetical protein